MPYDDENICLVSQEYFQVLNHLRQLKARDRAAEPLQPVQCTDSTTPAYKNTNENQLKASAKQSIKLCRLDSNKIQSAVTISKDPCVSALPLSAATASDSNTAPSDPVPRQHASASSPFNEKAEEPPSLLKLLRTLTHCCAAPRTVPTAASAATWAESALSDPLGGDGEGALLPRTDLPLPAADPRTPREEAWGSGCAAAGGGALTRRDMCTADDTRPLVRVAARDLSEFRSEPPPRAGRTGGCGSCSGVGGGGGGGRWAVQTSSPAGSAGPVRVQARSTKQTRRATAGTNQPVAASAADATAALAAAADEAAALHREAARRLSGFRGGGDSDGGQSSARGDGGGGDGSLSARIRLAAAAAAAAGGGGGGGCVFGIDPLYVGCRR